MRPLHCRCLLTSSGSKAESAVTLWNRSDTSWLCRSTTTAEQVAGHLRRKANLRPILIETRQQATILPPPSCRLINLLALLYDLIYKAIQTNLLQVIQTYPPDPAVKWGSVRSLGGAVVLMMLIMIHRAENALEGRPDIRRQLFAILFDVDIATSEDFWPTLAIKKA